LAGLCGVMMLVSGSLRGEAGAAEWSAEPSLRVKGEYNSNLLLFNGNNEVWGNWVSPGLKFKGSTESLEVEGNVKSDFVKYYGSTDRSLTNLYFPVRASYRLDRYTFGFEGGFTRDNTLRSELQQTGVVLAFTQRNLWTANPTWSVGLTERLNWQIGYQFTDAQYENGLSLGLVNYQVQAGSSALAYKLNERDQVQLTGEYVNFTTPDIQQQVSYYGVGALVSHAFSQSIIATASGGPRFVTSTKDFSGGSASQHDLVWIFNAKIRKDFERSSVLIEGSHEINPSGFGTLLKTDRLGGTVTHNLTETVTLSINGYVYYASAVASPSGSTAFPDSRYGAVSPKVSWKLGEWWTVDVAYTYAERAVDSLNQWNFANSTFVTLTYGGPKWSVSR
jgi:hypothetical protein